MTKVLAPTGLQVGGSPNFALTNSPYQQEQWGAPTGPAMLQTNLGQGTSPSPLYSDPYWYEGQEAARGEFAGGVQSGYQLSAVPSPEAVITGQSVAGAPTPSPSPIRMAGQLATNLTAVGAVLGGVGAVGSLIMNWWAADQQMRENRKAREQAQQMYQEQMTESKRRYDIETGFKEAEAQRQQRQFMTEAGLATRKEAFAEKISEEELAAKKEQQQWDRWLMLMNNMVSMMSTPQSRAQTAQLYRR
jgi:DNA-dependent RNA polymerase auxiliary subunit epsilon